jgi:hypothetical protein
VIKKIGHNVPIFYIKILVLFKIYVFERMLHELVMCLLGNVGGLFQIKIENNVKKIKVRPFLILKNIRKFLNEINKLAS